MNNASNQLQSQRRLYTIQVFIADNTRLAVLEQLAFKISRFSLAFCYDLEIYWHVPNAVYDNGAKEILSLIYARRYFGS